MSCNDHPESTTQYNQPLIKTQNTHYKLNGKFMYVNIWFKSICLNFKADICNILNITIVWNPALLLKIVYWIMINSVSLKALKIRFNNILFGHEEGKCILNG